MIITSKCVLSVDMEIIEILFKDSGKYILFSLQWNIYSV